MNIINQCEGRGGRGYKISKVQWEEAKWGRDTIFDLTLVGETLEETMG